MISEILSTLFGGSANTPAISHYEIKQYTGGTLQNTWTASVVHETGHGYSFVDLATGAPVTVSGSAIKITGVLVTPAAPATDATAAQ